MAERPKFTSVDEYMASVADEARIILQLIRSRVADAIPEASERISYQMPAFCADRVFFYYAAFEQHIGLYPPLPKNHVLSPEIARYRGGESSHSAE